MLLETSKFFQAHIGLRRYESINWTILTIGRYNEVFAAVSYFQLLSARTNTVAYKLCSLHISSLHFHYGFGAMGC
jgi:hypothetical protein